MATEENLDEIDIKILKLLQQNSRLTVKELAARVHPVSYTHLISEESGGSKG